MSEGDEGKIIEKFAPGVAINEVILATENHLFVLSDQKDRVDKKIAELEAKSANIQKNRRHIKEINEAQKKNLNELEKKCDKIEKELEEIEATLISRPSQSSDNKWTNYKDKESLHKYVESLMNEIQILSQKSKNEYIDAQRISLLQDDF